MLIFLLNQLRNNCFDNLDIVESVIDYLFVIGLHQFLLHICIFILVMFRFLQGNFFYILWYFNCCFSC